MKIETDKPSDEVNQNEKFESQLFNSFIEEVMLSSEVPGEPVLHCGAKRRLKERLVKEASHLGQADESARGAEVVDFNDARHELEWGDGFYVDGTSG